MNRQRRASYMAQMGIECWVPLRTLPAAAADHWVAANSIQPSTALSTQQSDVAPAQVPAAAGTGRGMAMAAALALGAESGTERGATNSATPKVNVVSENAPQPKQPLRDQVAAGADVGFTLVSALSGDLLIIDDIGALQFAPSAYQNWLNAILFSISRPALSASKPKIDRFVWPLEDAGLFEVTEQAAQDVAQAWFGRKLRENSVRHVLLMGEAAAHHLPAAENSGVLQTLSLDSSIHLLQTYGTAQLWGDPMLKKVFWQHLQALPAFAVD